MLMDGFAKWFDKPGPTDARRKASQSWSGECSTVASSWNSLFGQPVSLIASEGYCTPCGKTFLAEILSNCFVRLRQNLSFVIIPLKIASIIVVMSP
jgi:hypothetical protein